MEAVHYGNDCRMKANPASQAHCTNDGKKAQIRFCDARTQNYFKRIIIQFIKFIIVSRVMTTYLHNFLSLLHAFCCHQFSLLDHHYRALKCALDSVSLGAVAVHCRKHRSTAPSIDIVAFIKHIHLLAHSVRFQRHRAKDRRKERVFDSNRMAMEIK